MSEINEQALLFLDKLQTQYRHDSIVAKKMGSVSVSST